MAAHRLTATLARRSLRCHTRAAAIHTTAAVDGKRPSWLREVRRRSDDYAGWYRDVIAEADLVDQAPVKGYSKATQQMQHTYTNPSRVYPPLDPAAW